MVQTRNVSGLLIDGRIDLEAWLLHITTEYQGKELNLIRHACRLAQLAGSDEPAFSGESCLQQGLSMASTILELKPDAEAIASALIYSSVQYAGLSLDDLRENLGDDIAKLVRGVERMDAIRSLQTRHTASGRSKHQLDNLRKMLVAMVDDVRVVLVKLAEQIYTLRCAKLLGETKQREIARESMEIYAPLANRLGVSSLKWEIEDYAFRYLESKTYKEIAKFLDAKRLDREQYVTHIMEQLRTHLSSVIDLNSIEIYGRAKHIYSIYRKAQRKKIPYDHVYDAIAIRIIVPNIEACYSALGVVHSLWEQVPEEFDDYIATPKENGYRSLHTALKGAEEKVFEVQIRTFEMHQQAELGVAAHWAYKDGEIIQQMRLDKLAWLRQVLEWQKEMTAQSDALEEIHHELVEDQVYVFSPQGEIFNLPVGATPLDFAYTVHSDVGHRCRGAKIDGKIVPLTYRLHTGEQIEILTQKYPNPSRDWLNPHLGFLKTSRAKAKIHHWFKEQAHDANVAHGKELLEKEIKSLNIEKPDWEAIARQLDYPSSQDLFANVSIGTLKIGAVLHRLTPASDTLIPPTPILKKKIQAPSEVTILGVDNLLTHPAKCCKPIPGDDIVGYITQNRGVSIHRRDCHNIECTQEQHRERLVAVQWGESKSQQYPVDFLIEAYDRHDLVRDLTSLITNERITILSLHTDYHRQEHHQQILITVELKELSQITRLVERMAQVTDVIQVRRV